MIGSGIGGVEGIAENAIILHEKGPRRVSPFFIPGRIINLASGYVSIAFGLKGPNHAVVTACSTGAHAIGDAARMVALGDADVMVAGGTESPVNRIALAGFAALRALSTGFNDDPKRASRPYDKDRDGFVMGEGAGTVVLEELDHAKAARRQDLCRAGRLRHVGRRLSYYRAVTRRRRRVPLHEHGASSAPAFPRTISTTSMRTAPRRRSATRSNSARCSAWSAMPPAAYRCRRPNRAIGHLLGAAGAVEAIFSILAIRDGVAPPTINLDNPSVETPIDLVPHEARKREIDMRLVEFVRLRRHQCLAGLPPL